MSYEDILHLPRPVSQRHARMSPADRAAQFSPFAALTGYEETVAETARLTQSRIELGPDATQELDRALAHIRQILPARPRVCLTYFQPDKTKSGGSYRTAAGKAARLDSHQGVLMLEDGRRFFFRDILEIRFPEET